MPVDDATAPPTAPMTAASPKRSTSAQLRERLGRERRQREASRSFFEVELAAALAEAEARIARAHQSIWPADSRSSSS